MKNVTKLALFLSILALCSHHVDAAESSESNKTETTSINEKEILPSASELLSIRPNDTVLGKADAPVKIFEYTSFTCPHCMELELSIIPKLEEKYITTGQVAIIFRDFPLDHKSLKTSMLEECTDNKIGFRRAAFASLATDLKNSRNISDLSTLRTLAMMANISDVKYVKCIEDEKVMNDIIQNKYAAARVLNVGATPTMFINNQKYEGLRSLEEIQSIIEQLIPQASQAQSVKK